MRRDKQMRPRLESMESKLLLTAQAMSGLASAVVSTPTPVVKLIELNGNVQGAYHEHIKNPDIGADYTFFGSGVVNGRHTAITGHIAKVGFIAVGAPGGKLFLSDARGTITLKVTGVTGDSKDGLNGGLPTLFKFEVEGGTGAYRNEHGSGQLTLDLTPHAKPTAAKPGLDSSGHFSIQFFGKETPVTTS